MRSFGSGTRTFEATCKSWQAASSIALLVALFSACSSGQEQAHLGERVAAVELADIPDADPVHLPVPEQPAVGAIPGEADVSGGAASYRIPIEVPPGRAGMEPGLALAYNSRSSDRTAGLGWSLEGLSSIHRCARTVAQDGYNRAVRFDSDDALCLNGTRLVQVESPTPIPFRTEYRTEIDTFARIERVQRIDPFSRTYFIVTEKSGLKHWYGQGAYSQFSPKGTNSSMTWGLSKTVDRDGNRIDYSYKIEDDEHLLDEIRYTGFGDETGDRVIRFSYISGSHHEVRYLSGAALTSRWHLRRMTSYVADQRVRTYELHYDYSDATGASLLTQLGVCGKSGCDAPELVPRTSFRYDSDRHRYLTSSIPGATKDRVVVISDIDGDGTREKAYLKYSSEGGTPREAYIELTSTGERIDVQDTEWEVFDPKNGSTSPSERNTDFDRDGVDDLYGTIEGYFAIASWNGSSLTTKISDRRIASADGQTGRRIRELADFDGDGDTDLLVYNAEAKQYWLHLNCTEKNSPTISFCGTAILIDPNDDNLLLLHVLDFDGDGLLDLLFKGGQNDRVWFGRRGDDGLFYDSARIRDLGGPSDSTVRLLDINGDSLIDIFKFPDDLYVNIGGEFERHELELPIPWVNPKLADAIIVADTDHDGADELLIPRELTRAYCYNRHVCDEDNDDGTEENLWNDDLIPCGEDLLDAPSSEISSYVNKSIYRWHSYSFRPNVRSNTWRFAERRNAIEAPLNSVTVTDFDGDGFVDFQYTLREKWASCDREAEEPIGYYEDGSSGLGHFVTDQSSTVNTNLMTEVEDGLGRSWSWSYAPLSSEGTSSCERPGARPFYRVSSREGQFGKFYFSSSLRVVDRYDEPSGLGEGSAANSICYRYEDAMYSDQGRGFLGFRRIHEEQLIDGEPASQLRETVTFKEDFPLTGSVASTSITLLSDPEDATPISSTTNFYSAGCILGGICRPRLNSAGQVVADLATRDQLYTTRQVYYRDYDAMEYGNVSGIKTVVEDAFTTRSSYVAFDYDYSRVDDWWLDKLRSRSKTTDPAIHKTWPFNVPEDRERVVTVNLDWTPDGEPGARQLSELRVESGDASSSYRANYTYDRYGNLDGVSQIGSDATETREIVWTSTDDGYFTQSENNSAGHGITSDTDPATGLVTRSTTLGVTIAYNYDDWGRKLTSRQLGFPSRHERILACDESCPPQARIKAMTVQNGSPIVVEFIDDLGRVVRTESAGMRGEETLATVTEYDARGNLRMESEPFFVGQDIYGTTYENYDALGRHHLKRVDRTGQTPNEFVTRYTYEGLTTDIELAGSITASRTYGASGLLLQTVDGRGVRTIYRHDGAGNMVQVMDTAVNLTRSEYDDFGRKIAMNEPHGGRTEFDYNGFGELIGQTDANGDVLEFHYDFVGRLIRRDLNGAADAQWVYDYDRPGTLTYEWGQSYSRAITYDDLLRPTREAITIDSRSFAREYAYDGFYGRMKGMSYPSGDVIRYEFDPYGYRTAEKASLGEGEVTLRNISGLSPRGMIAEAVYGNGTMIRNESYASTGQLRMTEARSFTTTDPNAPPLQRFEYFYEDPFMNLTRRRDAFAGVYEKYRYDQLQRLTNTERWWEDTGRLQEVGYLHDDLGNLKRKDDYASIYRYGNRGGNNESNAGPHAIVSVRKVDGTEVDDFLYDENGNMVAGDGRTFEYNAFNRPTRIQDASGESTFFYGPNGERLKQVSPQGTKLYVGSDYEYVIKENELPVDRLYIGDYLLINGRSDGSREYRYLYRDQLGSVTTVADNAGEVVERHAFDPFGEPLDSDWERTGSLLHSGEFGETNTELGFTGHEHLDSHRLIHMGGRLYDPKMGRFLGIDPFISDVGNLQALNPYAYVQNNPLAFIDPTGYQQACPEGNPNQCQTPAAPEPEASDQGNGQEGQGATPGQDTPQIRQAIWENGKDAGERYSEGDGIVICAGGECGGGDGSSAGNGGGAAAGNRGPNPGSDVGPTPSSAAAASESSTSQPSPATDAAGSGTITRRAGETGGGNGGGASAAAIANAAAVASAGGFLQTLGSWIGWIPLPVISSFGGFIEAMGQALQGNHRAAAITLATSVVPGGKYLRKGVGGLGRLAKLRNAATGVCFAAGTLVHTERGLVSIEEVQVGDLVWSRDDETGEEGYRPVARTFVTPDQPTLELKLVGDGGDEQTLEVTGEHPFWLRERGWLSARELLSGDEVYTSRGGWLRVSSATRTERRTTVYNFEVGDFHTYFVGDVGVWVHNSCVPKPSLSAHKRALKEVHAKIGGSLPPGKPGKFGSPQAGTSKRGYRLDPPHPNAPKGTPEAGYHFNVWDYTAGKRGRGGLNEAVEIVD